MFGSICVGGNDAAREPRQSRGVHLPGSAAVGRDVAFLGHFRRREIAGQFARRWHGGAQQTGIQHLVEVFVPGEEEQLVAVLIESRAGNQHRTADGAAGIVILVFRARLAAGVEERVIGVQDVVAGIEEARTVKILAARFGHRRDHRRTFLVLGAEVRHLHLELRDHVRVRIHRRIAVAARIRNVRAIRRDIQRVAGQPVVGVGGVQRALAAGIAVGVDADRLPGVVRLVRRPVGDAEARHDLDELGRVAAHLNEILQLLLVDDVRLLRRIHRRDCVDRSGDLDRLTVAPTVNWAFTLRLSPPLRVIPSTLNAANPVASIVSS